MTRVLSAILSMAFIVSVAACRKPPAEPQASAAQAAQKPAEPGATPSAAAPPVAPPKPMPAALPAVVARVNGQDVTKAEFDRLVKNMELSAGAPIPAERRDALLRGSLEQLITYTLLQQEVKARKMEVTAAELDARVADMKKEFQTEAEFKKALADRGMTALKLREDARMDILITRMMEAEVANLPSPNEQQARDFYQQNPDKFQKPEVRASHILIATGGADDATKKKLRSQAEALLKQIKGGADFAQLAREHSKDGSATQGGDLGFFAKDQMVPEFDKAAWAMKPGELSDIVETQFGYHIIKVTDRRTGVPFEEVSVRIVQFLNEKQKRERAEAFVDGLKKKARIEVLV